MSLSKSATFCLALHTYSSCSVGVLSACQACNSNQIRSFNSFCHRCSSRLNYAINTTELTICKIKGNILPAFNYPPYHRDIWGSGGTAWCSLWLYPKESTRYPQVKTLWGSTSSVDAVEKRKISWPAWFLCHPAWKLVMIPTELSWLILTRLFTTHMTTICQDAEDHSIVLSHHNYLKCHIKSLDKTGEDF